jgi:hypothetical protein
MGAIADGGFGEQGGLSHPNDSRAPTAISANPTRVNSHFATSILHGIDNTGVARGGSLGHNTYIDRRVRLEGAARFFCILA